MTNAFATSTGAGAEYTFAAANQGSYAGATGKQFSVRVATIFELASDRIQRSSDYYNLGTTTAQLAPVATSAPARTIADRGIDGTPCPPSAATGSGCRMTGVAPLA